MTDTHDSEVVATAFISFDTLKPAPVDDVTITADPILEPQIDVPPVLLPLTIFARSRVAAGAAVPSRPDQYSVDLPSGGLLYEGGIRDVVASLVRGRHQVKFTRAARYASYRYTAEAVGSTLGEGADVMAMTQQDMLFLMYWLRTNSYPKMQFTHVSYCDSPEHLKKVESGELSKETLKNLEIVNQANLDVTRLEPGVIAAFSTVVETQYADEMREINALGYALGAPLVRDVAELSEVVDDEPWVNDEDAQELLDFALYLHPITPPAVPEPLSYRAGIAGDLSPAALALLNAWQVLVTNYGVRETRGVTCGTCGHSRVVDLLLTASDFV